MNDNYIIIYAIMPSEIYKTKDLTSEEKLIAERITALCKKEGYAWIRNEKLKDNIKNLMNTINELLEMLAKLFKKILHIGTDKDKDEVELNVKNLYDKELYSKWEVDDIGKGSTKEVPLKIHVGLLPKGYDKSIKNLNRESEKDIAEFQKQHKNKEDDLSL